MRWLRTSAHRTLVLAILGALAAAAAPVSGSAATSTPRSGGHSGDVAAAVSVNLFGHASTPARAASPVTKGFMPTPRRASTTAGGGALRVAALPAGASTGSFLAKNISFPTTSEDAAVSALGADQALEPPDTMLAAGPTSLIQMINSSISLWSKTGTRMGIADLNKILPIPSGYAVSDPWILYDTSSGRFFFSILAFSLNHSSRVLLGISKSSDPTGGFWIYTLAPTTNGQLHDQPKLGVSDDKAVLSWNEFCCGILGTFAGAETFVLDKSTLLTGGITTVYFFGPNPAESSPVPAQSLSSTSTEYVTFNGTTFAGVLAIDGLPSLNNVTVTETDVPIPATSAPPAAAQPGGTIETNDDRFLSSVWLNGNMWVSGNDGCKPGGTSTTRACLRLVQISTAGGTPALTQSFDVGVAGVDLYYPAVTLDPSQNLFVAFTGSSASAFPAAIALDVLASAAPGTISGAVIFQAGGQKYGGTRWGDYSVVSIDPTTSQAWAAAEYSAVGSSHDWGTAAAALTA